MPCAGECRKQEQRVRNMRVDTITPDPDNPDGCDDEPPRRIQQDVARAVKEELERERWITECEDDDCSCSGSWGEWGEPVAGERSKGVTVGECKYTIKFTYEIQGRLYSGVCVTTGGTSAAMGIIPDLDVTVAVATDELPAQYLRKIKEILS